MGLKVASSNVSRELVLHHSQEPAKGKKESVVWTEETLLSVGFPYLIQKVRILKSVRQLWSHSRPNNFSLQANAEPHLINSKRVVDYSKKTLAKLQKFNDAAQNTLDNLMKVDPNSDRARKMTNLVLSSTLLIDCFAKSVGGIRTTSFDHKVRQIMYGASVSAIATGLLLIATGSRPFLAYSNYPHIVSQTVYTLSCVVSVITASILGIREFGIHVGEDSVKNAADKFWNSVPAAEKAARNTNTNAGRLLFWSRQASVQ